MTDRTGTRGTRRMQDVHAAPRDPEATFETPWHVLESTSLTEDQKEDLLCAWETEAQALVRAESEGMGGEGPTRLKEVRAALASLAHMRARQHPVRPPRHATPPGVSRTPPDAPLPHALRRRPRLHLGFRSLGVILWTAAAGLGAWLIWRTGEAFVLGLLVGVVVSAAVLRPGRGLTSTVCTTCGGSGYVPAQDPQGDESTAPCPLCVPNDAKGG